MTRNVRLLRAQTEPCGIQDFHPGCLASPHSILSLCWGHIPTIKIYGNILTSFDAENTWWLEVSQAPSKVTPEKGPNLRKQRRWNKKTGTLEEHWARPNVWHQFQLPPPKKVCDRIFCWSKYFNLREFPRVASLKIRYLHDGRRLRRTFGIPERHSERSNVWYQSHLPAPPNVNDQNFRQSDSS